MRQACGTPAKPRVAMGRPRAHAAPLPSHRRMSSALRDREPVLLRSRPGRSRIGPSTGQRRGGADQASSTSPSWKRASSSLNRIHEAITAEAAPKWSRHHAPGAP